MYESSTMLVFLISCCADVQTSCATKAILLTQVDVTLDTYVHTICREWLLPVDLRAVFFCGRSENKKANPT